MNKHQITYLSPEALKPYPRNARTHSKKQIRQIADSIREFGFTNPVLTDQEGGIVAGHGRVEAAKLLGMESVPTICLENLTEAQIRAYVIADNNLAENAGWDRELLGIELQYLSELADEIPEGDDAASPVTRAGDLWLIGNHRLACGDSTDPATYDQLLAGEQAQMIFADPPYNVPVDGHVCGLGSVKHREFAMAAGEMSGAEFTSFLSTVFNHLAKNAVDGAIHFVCMDWRHVGEVTVAGKVAYSELKNICVWAKTNGGMGSLYRSQHEFVFVYKSGSEPHINNIELGKHGRYRTNVWTYPGVNSFGKSRGEDLAMHPTVKPIALVTDAILDCSRRQGIVLDPFAGSGTTLLAAERTGRRGFGVELDPRYCDVIIQRMAKVFGLQAVHAETGQSFSDLKAQRTAENPATNPGEGPNNDREEEFR